MGRPLAQATDRGEATDSCRPDASGVAKSQAARWLEHSTVANRQATGATRGFGVAFPVLPTFGAAHTHEAHMGHMHTHDMRCHRPRSPVPQMFDEKKQAMVLVEFRHQSREDYVSLVSSKS